MTAPPVALTIAGSDSSAGAGIQADLKTFSFFGVYGVNAVTCVVAEVPDEVSQVVPMSGEVVAEQIALLFKRFPVRAIKTGLLCTRENVLAVAKAYDAQGRSIPMVVDPVMIASSGDTLLQPDAVDAYERELFPRATLITPNAVEAATLSGRRIRTLDDARIIGHDLAERYGTAVLLKGGHIDGDSATDVLFANAATHEFVSPFVHHVRTHGTGCTYSAAITANLARGFALIESITVAKRFVSQAIAQHFTWQSAGGVLQALNHAPDDAAR